ncbi:PREDICTED: malate dehydrogenase-like [Priapulus caudatus]|uniref:Malate dehydrogenase, cytoplasmic n=1 Tax=Priapulus caudatus TaxID=37621 RepID=A0ABM1EIT3_PRICU|nr:PREDICTED: malate dehydrogenase-like [Priapulus caudatus]
MSMASGVVQVQPIWTELGPERAKALPAFHAFTGADNTGRFSRIGKATWLQVYFKAGGEVINALQMLSDAAEVTEELLLTLTTFVCSAYAPKGIQIASIPELRWHLFCKHMAESDKLPPTLGALKQHIHRVQIQATVQECLFSPIMHRPLPVQHSLFFGDDQPLELIMLDVKPLMGVLEGVLMELNDCAFPLLRGIIATADEETAFTNVDAALLLSAMPRKWGMERKDLLAANVKMVRSQGKALNKWAKKSVKVVVVEIQQTPVQPIAAKYAPSIPSRNFSAMTRLDQNRAQSQVAARVRESGVGVDAVSGIVVWGNHSSSQIPDVSHASVEKDGRVMSVCEAVGGNEWLKESFVKVREQCIFENEISSVVHHFASSLVSIRHKPFAFQPETAWTQSELEMNQVRPPATAFSLIAYI